MIRTDRYILRQLLGSLVFVTAALTGVVWLSQSLRFVDLIVNQGLSLASFVVLTLLLLPTFLALILPIALFCAVLYTYHRMSIDRELVVLGGCGVGLLGLARPVAIASVLVLAALYAVTLYLMPAGYRAFKDRQFLLRSDLGAALLQEGVFTTFGDRLTVYIRAIGRDGEASGILVHDGRSRRRPVTMMAEKGILARGERGPVLTLVNGNRQEISADRTRLSLLYFDRYSLDLAGLIEPSSEHWREPRERFIGELLGPPERKADIRNAGELRAEVHQRLVTPWLAPALAFIALAAVMAGDATGRRATGRVWFAIGATAGFEGVFLVLERSIIATPGLVPALYAWVLGAPLASWLIAHHRRPRWRPAIS